MVLDQGYWPDGGMTAPSDEASARRCGVDKEVRIQRRAQTPED
jgi:hypothetical protein